MTRADAGQLGEDDVIAILLTQHARVTELFADIKTATGTHKQQAFDELRALLAAHETGEEMILRPVSKDLAGPGVADARNKEEAEATRVLADLEKMDAGSAEFDRTLAEFQAAVTAHAAHEESEEFPRVLANCPEDQRARMGKALRAAEHLAPTHAHPGAAGSPAAQWAVGPFASLVDRVRDVVKGATKRG
jgi:hemerythrin superfamily protein